MFKNGHFRYNILTEKDSVRFKPPPFAKRGGVFCQEIAAYARLTKPIMAFALL